MKISKDYDKKRIRRTLCSSFAENKQGEKISDWSRAVVLMDVPIINDFDICGISDLFPNAGCIVNKLNETKPNQNCVKKYKYECEYSTVTVRQFYPNIGNSDQNDRLNPVMITMSEEKNETKKDVDISTISGGFSMHKDMS